MILNKDTEARLYPPYPQWSEFAPTYIAGICKAYGTMHSGIYYAITYDENDNKVLRGYTRHNGIIMGKPILIDDPEDVMLNLDKYIIEHFIL